MKQDFLRGCALFKGASQETLDKVSALATIQTEPKGTDLFYAGDGQDGLRIVLSGMVRIWMSDAEGRELTLTLLESGEAFGEMALLDNQPRSANATVLEAAQFLVLSKAAFDELLDADMAVARHVIRALSGMLRQANSDLHDLAFRDLETRLVLKLCQLAESHADIVKGRAVFRRKFSQSALATMLGATREAVNKRLAVLVQNGLIEVVRGKIVVKDMAALLAWADKSPGG